MDITPLIGSDRKILQGYKAGSFRVSGQRYEGPIIVFPDKVMAWHPENPTGIVPEDFAVLWESESRKKPELLLFGCGGKQRFYPPSFKQAVKAHGIAIEVMETGAACRTYNVLLADGRSVAAALLPVEEES